MITETKTCSNCHQPKTLDQFYTDSGVKLRSACKPCELKRWRDRKAGIHLPAYQRRIAAYLASPNVCKHCNRPILPATGQLLSLVKSKSFCNSACAMAGRTASEEAIAIRKAKEKARHAARSKRKKQERCHARLLRDYGEELASAWKAVCNEPTPHSKQRIYLLKKAIIKSRYGLDLSKKEQARAEQLNRAAGLPLLNIGWHCLRCGLAHKDPAFFDVDHIIPRADGGTDDQPNLQVLCPNCHKKKSCGIDGVSPRQSFKANILSNTTMPALQLGII